MKTHVLVAQQSATNANATLAHAIEHAHECERIAEATTPATLKRRNAPTGWNASLN